MVKSFENVLLRTVRPPTLNLVCSIGNSCQVCTSDYPWLTLTVTNLGPRSFRFSSFKICSKTAGLIETTLHIKAQWDKEIKVCSWDLDHMTKMSLCPYLVKGN